MKQEAFEARHKKDWDQFEAWLTDLSGRKSLVFSRYAFGLGRENQFPRLYRKICHHLALARARQYSAGLQQKLNRMALDGHQYLYRSHANTFGALLRFFVDGFPRSLKQHGRYMLVSCLLFFATGALVAVAVTLKPDLVYAIMEPSQVANMEEMYDPANDVIGRDRDSGTDTMMFGYYIYNNISIGFRTFAGGLLFGIGTIFFLVFNGLVLGAVATHLTAVGFSSTFWSFVAGHSSFELIAIAIFGAVGLALGRVVIAPGRKTRWGAVRDQARDSMPLIYGGTVMLLIAAFVEAFWSATTWPPNNLKYGVGITFWLLHILYFTLLGRNES